MHKLLSFLLVLLASTTVAAGSIPIAWSAPTDTSNLAGYTVTVSTTYPVSAICNPTRCDTLSVVTSYIIPNLTDCRTWYIGVRSRGLDGTHSDFATYSGQQKIIKGWPSIRVDSVSVANPTITLVGSNFGPNNVQVIKVGTPNILLSPLSRTCSTLTFNGGAGSYRVTALQEDGVVIYGSFVVTAPDLSPPSAPTLFKRLDWIPAN